MYADSADSDGCNAGHNLTIPKLAEATGVSERMAQYRLRRLVALRCLQPGNQAFGALRQSNRRPTVYDMPMVPLHCRWSLFGGDLPCGTPGHAQWWHPTTRCLLEGP